MGFNVFDPKDYDSSGLGYGHSFMSVLKPKETGVYNLDYEIGVNEKNSTVPVLAPSSQNLQKLKQEALNATLIVTINKKEIASFDLNQWKK